MKYSLFTVSVPELTLEEALEKIKKLGYDGVDFRVAQLPKDDVISEEKPSYWRNNRCTVDLDAIEEKAVEIRRLADQYGMEINCLATYLCCSDSSEKIESCMRAAQVMGCGKIRVNTPGYDKGKGYRELFAESVRGFERVEKLSGKYRIKADFEMHMGNITASASAARNLASWFDPAYIGVIYDTGNVIYEGFEEYQMAFEILGPYLDLVHVKNAKWSRAKEDGKEKYLPGWAALKDGFADFERCFQALKACGYDGYITFEDFSDNEGPDQKLRNNIHYIKKIVDDVYGRREEEYE